MTTPFALPPLRDLLFSLDDDELWVPGGGGGGGCGVDLLDPSRAAAPHGADPSQLRLIHEPHAAHGGGGGGAGGGLGSLHPGSTASLLANHPLWPALVDVYFACIKVCGLARSAVAELRRERYWKMQSVGIQQRRDSC